MKMIRKTLLALVFICTLVIIYGASHMPIKEYAHSYITKELAKRGLPAADFNVDSIGINEAVFSNITLPWQGGTISVKKLHVPYFETTPLDLSLNVKNVSLDALLSASTGSKARATGVVSGVLPVIVTRDGSFTLKNGSLKTASGGVINLSPDLIPGDIPQVALVRDALKDFRYTDFSMAIKSADDKQLSMLLSLQGNNPDVYNGRTVKLNVHLTGDVVELMTQTMQILGK
jgi:hypothetical protein